LGKLASILDKWDQTINSGGFSQKVLDKVRPESSLKNKFSDAQKKLQAQVIKLNCITEKLQQKDDVIFKKIVDAQKANNHSYAKAYAIELQEIRKMNNMVSNAKISMEQIQIRLNTVSELGDVVVTLSPCMSVIKGLSASLGGIMPEAASSMQDLSKILGGMLSGASISEHGLLPNNTSNADTLAILEEAHSVIEGQTKATIPELPSDLITNSQKEKESPI